MIHTLEEQFRSLSAELHYTPPEPIAVILYTREVFRDVTRAPGWAGAGNDGRIRVPVQGVETVSPELTRVLKHELTHSFVYQKTTGRCPTWLNEGIAQWMEGRRTGADAGPLVASFERRKRQSAAVLSGSWTNLTAPQARFAYAWSLAVVEAIEAQSGSDCYRPPARCGTNRGLRRGRSAPGATHEFFRPRRNHHCVSSPNLFTLRLPSAAFLG